MSAAYAPLPPTPDPHDFDRVDEVLAGFVLRCRCGWASTPSWSAADIGHEWDRHRREVGADHW